MSVIIQELNSEWFDHHLDMDTLEHFHKVGLAEKFFSSLITILSTKMVKF